jgi:hypothetical protein
MAITVAFLNVILRQEAYRALDAQGRWIARQAFRWKPEWFRFDDHLMATTFLAPHDVRAFCTWLEARTGLRRGADYAVWDAGFGPPDPPDWLEGDVTAMGIGWAAFRGEPETPQDPIVDLIPGPCMRVQFALDRDSLKDPEDENGRRRRPEGTPDWGGTGVWFFAKPGTPEEKDPRVEVPMVSLDFGRIAEYLDSITGADQSPGSS